MICGVNRTETDSVDCYSTKGVNVTITEECRRNPLFKESWFSSSYYKRYEECITLFGLTLVACDNIVILKTICMCFFVIFLPVLEVCGCN